MEYFETILNNAIKRCENINVYDEAYSRGFSSLYPFSTENISGYIDNFNLEKKSLLTVGSSADQALNAILKNCKDITVLDINPYTKYYYYLKASGIIELSKEEFLRFFRYEDYPNTFKKNKEVFNKETYNKLKETLRRLDYESYLFWDELLSTYKGEYIRNKLFSLDEEKTHILENINPYLENENYKELKSKIKKVNPEFIIGNIFKTDIDKTFDNIWLSNIGTYISRHYLKIMTDKTSNLLNEDGILLISYLYETVKDSKYQEDWNLIYDLEKTLSILKEYHPEFISFIGVKGLKFNDENVKDSVLVYKNRIRRTKTR